MVATQTTEPIACWDEQLKLGYLQAGESGPPVVLLHGLGAFKELWWSTVLALAPRYRVFALDMPGHGDSPLAHNGEMAGLARLIANFCAARGLERIALVGHSMGGNVALELALLRPELVERLVLVDAAANAPGLVPLPVNPLLCITYGWPALRIGQHIRRLVQPLGRRVRHTHGGGWVRPLLRRQAYAATLDPAGQYALLQGLFANPLLERVASLSVPTLVISGQLDTLIPLAHTRRLARAIPGARLAIIPAAIHNPMDERPRAFARLLLGFLSESRPAL
jgi:pimeloyl-ACP methyl ester carboxylesterase